MFSYIIPELFYISWLFFITFFTSFPSLLTLPNNFPSFWLYSPPFFYWIIRQLGCLVKNLLSVEFFTIAMGKFLNVDISSFELLF